jgi:hypothetical protein
MAPVDFAFDAPRDIFDPGDVGDRRAAELLNNARHAFSNLSGKFGQRGPTALLPGSGNNTYSCLVNWS